MKTAVAEISIDRYPAYKDSGVLWLGDIPEHWRVESFKNILVERNEKNDPIRSKERLSLSIDKGVTSYAEKTTNLDRFKDDLTQYKLAYKGDLVLNSMNMIVGAVGVSKYFGCVSPVYYTYHGGPDNSYTSKFYEYLFRCKTVQGVLYSLGRGLIAIDRGEGKYNTLRLKISREDLRSLKLPFPNPSEQSAIVAFLDRKTAEIDLAIAQKERLIELLKERRQILIHKAVTRGLNPDVKMKDSGVEWIGEVPEHWEVKRLKHIVVVQNTKVPSKDSPVEYIGMENIEPWTGRLITSESEVEGLANLFEVGNILFGKLRPYLAKVYLAEKGGICSTEFLVLKAVGGINSRYLHLLMISFGFISLVNSSTYGTKMPRANADFVINQFVPVPPSLEQQNITDHVNSISEKLSKAISSKEKEIEKIKEYKATLINAAVTGKIKVTA